MGKRICFRYKERVVKFPLANLYYDGERFSPTDGGEMWPGAVFLVEHAESAHEICCERDVAVYCDIEGGTLFLPPIGSGYYIRNRISVLGRECDPWTTVSGVRRLTWERMSLLIKIYYDERTTYSHAFQTEPEIVSDETPPLVITQWHAVFEETTIVRVLFMAKNELGSVRGVITIDLLTGRTDMREDNVLSEILLGHIQKTIDEAREHFGFFVDNIRRMVGEATRMVVGDISSTETSDIEKALGDLHEKFRPEIARYIRHALVMGDICPLRGYLDKKFTPLQIPGKTKSQREEEKRVPGS